MNTLPDSIIAILFAFTAPLTSGVVCLIIIAVFQAQSKDRQSKQIARVLIGELAVCVFCWFSLICFIIAPQIYKVMESLFMLSILYAQVLTYRIIFLHTRIESNAPFSRWHYLLPLIPVAAMLVCSLVFSIDQRMTIRFERPAIAGEFAAYTLMVYLVPIFFFGYNLYYSIRSLVKIARYNRVVKNYSADEGRYSTGWLRLLVFIALSSLPLAMIPSVMGVSFFFNSLLTLVGMSAIVFKDVVLTYNTIARNYVLVYSENDEVEEAIDPAEAQADRKVNKEQFERYMRLKKPYLNSELRITDLAHELHTNRTYLSAFINQEYDMNFSRQINIRRLEELKKMSADPQFAHMNGRDLVINVGFSNYRGYLRFKNEEDKRSQIAIDR